MVFDLYGILSDNGLLADGGKATRAKMLYDASRRVPRFIVGNIFNDEIIQLNCVNLKKKHKTGQNRIIWR